MGSHDPRIDAYIAKAAPFAQPVLTYIRDTVHATVPDVEETVKWGMPHFDYKGTLCSMAAFKEHCAFGFWKAPLLSAEYPNEKKAMGQMGRITSVKDLPPKRELVRLIREAVKLNEEGVGVPRTKAKRIAAEPPPELVRALSKNRKAKATYEKFPPGQKREYIDWITEAKTDATREKRLAQAIEWMAEGKPRNWKYMK